MLVHHCGDWVGGRLRGRAASLRYVRHIGMLLLWGDDSEV
jgi:hypothetical protein